MSKALEHTEEWFPPALLCILHAGMPFLVCLTIYEPRSADSVVNEK